MLFRSKQELKEKANGDVTYGQINSTYLKKGERTFQKFGVTYNPSLAPDSCPWEKVFDESRKITWITMEEISEMQRAFNETLKGQAYPDWEYLVNERGEDKFIKNTLWKYFEGVYIGTEQDLIEETNLNHLNKLQEQVRQAHMHNKPYTIDSPNIVVRTHYADENEYNNQKTMDKNRIICIRNYHNANQIFKLPRYKADKIIAKYNDNDELWGGFETVPMYVWKTHLRKERLKRKKQAEINRLAQMEKYDSKTGNRKQRRKCKHNKWGQPGDRYAHLQLVAIKEKNEKVTHRDGRNILLTPKGIPYGDCIETKTIEPVFTYEPFEKIYHTEVTIDDEIRIIETGRSTVLKKFLIDNITWDTVYEQQRYRPVKYQTITQHLYPRHLQKLFVKRKIQVKEFQKELEKMQKEKKVKKIKKKQLAKVVKSKQKKGD